MKNKFLVFLVIILTIMVVGLGSYVVYIKFFDTKTTTKTEEKDTKKEDKTSILEDDNKTIVYDNENYKYLKVPYLNINTDDGKRINKEITEFVKDYKDTKEDTENFMINYDSFENSNILSVIIKKTTPSSSTNFYKAININSKTGKEITNKELLDSKKIKEDELAGRLMEVYDNQIKTDGSEDMVRTQHMNGDEFTSVYDGTKNKIEKTKLEELEMYLNNRGELIAAVGIYFVAGPDGGIILFNLDTNLYEK